MRKLDFFRLSAPRCASTASGAGSLKKSNFLMFSKVLSKAPDQAKCAMLVYIILSHLFLDLNQASKYNGDINHRGSRNM